MLGKPELRKEDDKTVPFVIERQYYEDIPVVCITKLSLKFHNRFINKFRYAL